MLKLSLTYGSPFARKVRIVLHELGLGFEEDDQSGMLRPADTFGELNPNLTVPVLTDGDKVLFESNLILEYLLATYPVGAASPGFAPLAGSCTRSDHHWEDAKILATLEAMADIMVNIRFFKEFGVAVEELPYGARQIVRFERCLDWLEARASREGFIPGVFSIQDINFICPIGYLDARREIIGDLLEWRGRPNLETIVESNAGRPSVVETKPGAPTRGHA